MTAITNEEFEVQYDSLSRSFEKDMQCILYGQMNGIHVPSSVEEDAKSKYLFIHALNSEINRSYLTEEQILKMLSYA